MTRARVAAAAMTAWCLGYPVMARAQVRDGAVEASIGAGWYGSSTFAEVASTQITPSGTVRTVARTTTSLDASLGVAARVGLSLTSRLAAEGAVSLNPTHLTTSVSDDIENFADPSATEPVTQYVFEGGLRWRLGGARATNFSPFLSAGGGYLRQLHDQQTFASTGHTYYVGGGGHYVFRRGRGWIRSSGLRFDIRMSVLSGGAATDETTHATPTAGAGLFIRF